jgi:hypothetical protein
MPAPTNTTPATATDLGAFPFATFTEDVSGGTGPHYDVWFKVTAATTEYLGLNAHAPIAGVYFPGTTIWTGPTSALVPYPPDVPISGFDQAVQFPVTSGETYYFRIRQENVGVPDNLLSMTGIALA